MQALQPELTEITVEQFYAIITGNQELADAFKTNRAAYSFSDNAIVFENIILTGKPDVLRRGTVDKDVFIVSGEFRDELILSGLTFNRELRVDGGTFHKMFGVEECDFKRGFTINGGLFRNDFCLFDGTFNRVLIKKGVFQENFTVFGGSFKEFSIENGTFQGGFTVESGLFSEAFSVSDGSFEKFIIANGDFRKNVWIEGGEYKNAFALQGGSFDRVFVRSTNELKIENLSFSFKQNPVKLVKLTNSGERFTINHLEFNDTILSKDAIVQLEQIRTKTLRFTATHNYGNISFTQVQPAGNLQGHSLSIINSDMGKTTIIDSDLSSFQFHFQSSKITDVFITGSVLPEVITPTTDQASDRILLREQQRLGYGQLKKIYDSRGDTVTANLYFAKEMNAYYQVLSWRKDGWEKINLGLNKFSTNHGQSWQRGLYSSLVVGALLFIFYYSSLGYDELSLTREGYNTFALLWSYFFEYINPIHKADYIAEQLTVAVTGWARIIEAVSRIATGYLIYQFIQAFRKHGRK